MKAKRKISGHFEPVTIEITLETKEEMEAFYCVFNYEPIRIASGLDTEIIRGALGSVFFGDKLFEFRDRLKEEIRRLRK